MNTFITGLNVSKYFDNNIYIIVFIYVLQYYFKKSLREQLQLLNPHIKMAFVIMRV